MAVWTARPDMRLRHAVMCAGRLPFARSTRRRHRVVFRSDRMEKGLQSRRLIVAHCRRNLFNMNLSPMQGHRHHRHRWLLLTTSFVVAVCISGGCASTDRGRMAVHEGPGEAVVLEPLTAATPARHPVAIEAAVVDRILRAIQVQQEERVLQRFLAGPTPPARVFSDEQVGVLAPLLVTAFSRAKTDQQIRVRLAAPESSVREGTQGVLYVSGSSLYFTLLKYPSRPLSQDRPGRQLPDPTGLQGRRLVFISPGISRDDDDRPPVVEERPPATLVINHDRLKQIASRTIPSPQAARDGVVNADPDVEDSAPRRVPVPGGRPERAPGSETDASRLPHGKVQDSGSLHELIVRKDLEIEALKDELRQLRRSYDLQRQELKRLKERKRQEAAPRN